MRPWRSVAAATWHGRLTEKERKGEAKIRSLHDRVGRAFLSMDGLIQVSKVVQRHAKLRIDITKTKHNNKNTLEIEYILCLHNIIRNWAVLQAQIAQWLDCSKR